MYDNIGEKIKGLARTICIIGIVLSVFAGIALIASGSNQGVAQGLLTMILGALCSWVGSLALYGFGELIVKINAIEKDMKTLNYMINKKDCKNSANSADNGYSQKSDENDTEKQ